MNDSTSNPLLNDLLIEIHRSLMQYASEAWPWTTEHAEELKGAVLNVAERQREDVGRLVHLLQKRRYYIDFGVYPYEYTSLHYVALEYLLTKLKLNQSQIVRWAEDTLSELQSLGDTEAADLVKQIIDSQRKGLEKLTAITLPGGPQAVAWMK